MTLSRNPELWQSLPAERQHELETSPEFIEIDEQLKALSLKSEDDTAARDYRKELYAQKRRLVSEALRTCRKLQPMKIPSKTQKTEQIGHHLNQFSLTSPLMPERRDLAESLSIVARIRSEVGRAALRDMISLCQQDTEVAVRLGLEPDNCHCAAERSRKIDR
jgi:hypothetical protein